MYDEVINNLDLYSMKYGVLCGTSNLFCLDSSYEFPILEYYKYCSSCDVQTLNSCDSNAACAIIENNIAKTFGEKINLDYNSLYRKATEKRYSAIKNREAFLDAGLFIGDSLRSAVELGILPPDTIISVIAPLRIDQIIFNLRNSPLELGFYITDGWKPKNVAENGAINESYRDSNYAHAVALVGTNIHENEEGEKIPFLILQNSWGKYAGMDGLCAISLNYALKTMCGFPCCIELTDT